VVENKGEYPFTSSEDDMNFAMAYYDPNYSCKRAYMEGKMIQIRHTPESEWVDLKREEPKWHSCYEYRVKPEPEMWTTCIDDECIISIMPACEWNKDKGRQLIESTEEECQRYVVENYCARCACQECMLKIDTKYHLRYCRNFMELKPVKKRRKTNRELAQWIAQGNGQMKPRDGKYILNTFNAYNVHDDNKPCPDYLVIRGWDETEWHEPEVEE
jgi:hypothetical protein